MRAVIQRVKSASVTVDSQVVSSISKGLLVLVGITDDDSEADCVKLAQKVLQLRLWPDDQNAQWKRSVSDLKGEVLCVSQFTLYGTVKKGTKPDFHAAAKGHVAIELYERVKQLLGESHPLGPQAIKDGQFGAMMDVALVNDGPVTIQFDTKESRRS